MMENVALFQKFQTRQRSIGMARNSGAFLEAVKLTTAKFDQLEWHSDHVWVKDWLFRMEHDRNEQWTGGSDYFNFYKVKRLMDEYRSFFCRLPQLKATNILEIGMWDGGSL